MATLSAYPNGLTMGCTNMGNPNPPKRGRVTGWTPAAARRHTKWLYSVDADGLTGCGYAVTLTVRDTPPSPEAWQAARRRWLGRLRGRGLVRVHWVVEWQERGTPHLHTAVYFDHELTPLERWQLVGDWLDVASEWGAGPSSQYVLPIDGPVGWLRYLSKHASRGVHHYQRQGKPDGWETSGRLWGHSEGWPTLQPVQATLTTAEFHRFRRLVRSWRVANARAAGDLRRLRYARRMLACPDARLSAVRGVSEWIPEAVALRLLDVATSPAL